MTAVHQCDADRDQLDYDMPELTVIRLLLTVHVSRTRFLLSG